MKYDQFIGLVQNRAHMASTEEAVAATRATLETLAERIDSGEAEDLASQLPREIGNYLHGHDGTGERFSFDDFCERISHREHIDKPEAVFHARCVIEVLEEAVSPGEIRDVRSQLPNDFQTLFEAGSVGRMRQRAPRGKARGGRSSEAAPAPDIDQVLPARRTATPGRSSSKGKSRTRSSLAGQKKGDSSMARRSTRQTSARQQKRRRSS